MHVHGASAIADELIETDRCCSLGVAYREVYQPPTRHPTCQADRNSPLRRPTSRIVTDPGDVEAWDIVKATGDEEERELSAANSFDGAEDDVANENHEEADYDEGTAHSVLIRKVGHDEEDDGTEYVDWDRQELRVDVGWIDISQIGTHSPPSPPLPV